MGNLRDLPKMVVELGDRRVTEEMEEIAWETKKSGVPHVSTLNTKRHQNRVESFGKTKMNWRDG